MKSLDMSYDPKEIPATTEGLSSIDLFSFELDPSYSQKKKFELVRPKGSLFYTVINQGDPAIVRLKERRSLEETLKEGLRVIEASLDEANSFICEGDLVSLKGYFESWVEITNAKDVTPQSMSRYSGYERQDNYTEVFPGYFEYLVFSSDEDLSVLIRVCKENTLELWFKSIITNDQWHFNEFWLPGNKLVRIQGRFGDYIIIENGTERSVTLLELENLVRVGLGLDEVSVENCWANEIDIA